MRDPPALPDDRIVAAVRTLVPDALLQTE